jgi:hypothetical protein
MFITNKVYAFVLMCALVLIGSQISVTALDAATTKQCKNHDWPVDTYKVHMDWCADNGYATK